MSCCARCSWFRRNPKKKEMKAETIGYVPVQGLGESIELLLAYGSKDIADVQFCTVKPDDSSETIFPNGQPLLEVHKKQYVQSTAISRYLGKRFGLTGADPFEDLEIDQIVEAFNDFRIKILSIHCEPEHEVRQKKLEEFNNNEAHIYLQKFDAVIAANNGHLALRKLTWADFVVAGLWDFLKTVLSPDVETKYPNIARMVAGINSIQRVKALREKPETTRADT